MKFNLDPSNENNNIVMQGVQHKYSPTVLVITTNQCFRPYCNYCFRKFRLYKKDVCLSYLDLFQYIREHDEITNILLSGGDPFVLSTLDLENIIMKIPKGVKIRIGTRSIITNPERIINDKFLVSLLKKYSVDLVFHINSLKEMNDFKVRKTIDILRKNGIILWNQAVLLKGVNNDVNVLVDLFKGLVVRGIRPYYIFQCRPVVGNEKCMVPLLEGCKLINEVRKQLSGLEKSFRFIMSTKEGKVEVLGVDGEKMVFRFHQCKYHQYINKIYVKQVDNETLWIDNLVKGVK